MSLGFINPLFLLGLAAGILPILIHRLTRRRAFTKKFSAVRLLIQSQQNLARPQRLKHFLLLTLRILTVATLVFLAARPILRQHGLLAMSGEGATVILVDNSASMGYRDEAGERFELAKKVAKEILQNLSGQVLVIPVAPVSRRLTPEKELRWMGSKEASQAVDEIPFSFGRGDPSAALASAFRALKDVKEAGNILIITDLARGDWEELDISKSDRVSAETGIAFLRIGGPGRDPNLTVKEVRVAEGEAVTGSSLRLETLVANYSDRPVSSSLSLILSGVKRDQKNLELKAGEERSISVDAFLEKKGWTDGELKLTGDFMPLDDSFYFALKARDKIKVLIVDGNPRRALKTSETYYLVNALNPGRGEEAAFLPRVVTESEFAGVDIRAFDALFLVDVKKPQGSRIASFLESGKPVFIFPGDQTDPGDYHAIPLFPWRLREVQERDGPKPQKIAQIDFTREALKGFSGSAGEGLKSALFRRYFRIEDSARNLLTFENGDPFLAQADIGKGKLFLFASGAGIDWNDLAMKAGYLPLIQGLLKEAVGLMKDSSPRSVRYGAYAEEKILPAQVRGTEGGPGVYRSFGEAGEFWQGVNLPLEESNLAKMTEKELSSRFGTVPIKVAEYKSGAGKELRGGQKELWPYLLGFLLLVLAVEMGVASRI